MHQTVPSSVCVDLQFVSGSRDNSTTHDALPNGGASSDGASSDGEGRCPRGGLEPRSARPHWLAAARQRFAPKAAQAARNALIANILLLSWPPNAGKTREFPVPKKCLICLSPTSCRQDLTGL